MEAPPHRQTAAARSRGRLTATLVLTCGFLVVEVAGALWSGSLALLADAGHMLADAAGLGLALLPRSWRILPQAVNVLLQGTQAHLDLGEIEDAMRRVPGVRRVHELHVWTLTSGREAMRAHAVVDDVRDSERLLETLHAVMHARFGIDHTTIQLETEPPVVLRIQGPNPI